MEPNQRAGQIDVVRSLAIIGVICLHSRFEHRFDPATLSVCAFLSVFFDWAVLAFFYLSGLLLDEKKPVIEFLKKRCWSLLVPFWFYNLFYNLAFGGWLRLSGSHINGFQWSPTLLLTGWLHSPAFQLYFLPYLFVIALGVFCLCKFINHRWQPWLFGASVVLMAAFYHHTGWPNRSHGPEWVNLPLYLVAFLLGVVCRPFFAGKPSRKFVMLSLSVGFLSLLLPQLVLQSLLVPPLLCMAVKTAPFLGESQLLQKIGRSSGVIYLWHTPIMLPAFTTMMALGRVPAIVNLGASLIASIALCVLLRHSMKKFWKRIFKTELPRSLVP